MRALAILLITATVLAAAPQSQTGCTGWVQVSTPNLSVQDNVLASIAANSSSDVWAVGQYYANIDPNSTLTLAEHFDGSVWSVVPTPNVGSKANALFSVAASGGLAWAVGYYVDSHYATRSLIEAWDGTSWTVVDHPSSGGPEFLFGVSANSPTDVWAVGSYLDSADVFQTLTEHFDGTAWSIVASPNAGATGNQLYGVKAESSTSAWAVGSMTGTHGPDQGAILHWDGSAWSNVPAAPDGAASEIFYSAAGSDSQLVIAGDAQDDLAPAKNLVEFGTAGNFALGSPRNVGPGEDHFYSVTVAPGNATVWTAGTYAALSENYYFNLIERFDSSGWVQEQTPNPGEALGGSELSSILAISPTDVWAVGAYNGTSSGLQTLALHRCQ